MQTRNINLTVALIATLLTLAPNGARGQGLTLRIDTTTGSLDWVDGTSITKIPGPDDNRFGNYASTNNAFITSPLPLYSGNGSLTGVAFVISPPGPFGSAIQGIAFNTTFPPLDSASFSGTPEGPLTPSFTNGAIAQFMSLSPGDYTLASATGAWNGGIRVQVVVPEPGAAFFPLLALGILIIWRARHSSA